MMKVCQITFISFSHGEKDVRARRADRMRGRAPSDEHLNPSPGRLQRPASPYGRGKGAMGGFPS
jgi:hypothetical protein